MSKKYIIEIEEEPLVRKSALHGEDAVYRASGFKSLVFDQSGLNTLIPANKVLTCGDADRLESEGYKRGYQNGLKKAWEAAQWICECQDVSWLYQAFGAEETDHIIPEITVEECIEAMEDYEDSSIVVGNEVEINDGINAVVLDETNEDGVFYVLTENGCVEKVNRTEMTTTGTPLTKAAVKFLTGDEKAGNTVDMFDLEEIKEIADHLMVYYGSHKEGE